MRLKFWKWLLPSAALACTALTGHLLGLKSEGSAAPSSPHWHVWTVSQMQRVGKNDGPSAKASMELWAAGGEYEAFQIVVTAGTDIVEDVDVQASDLVGPKQARIPASAFTFYREHYINITRSSPDPGYGNRPLGRGWYPDALIPQLDPATHRPPAGSIPSFPFRTAANENQPIWVDVYVPSGTLSGLYQATIRVFSKQGSISIPVSLHVWNFSLPVSPTLKSSFGMHEPALSDPRAHKLLLEHHVMPININSTDAREFQNTKGLNITGLHFWGGSDRQTCRMDSAPAPARFVAELKNYPRTLPVYVYPADEIDPCPNLYQTVRQWGANMHAADPRIKNLVTMAPVPALFSDGTTSGRSAVDVWVLLPRLYEPNLQQIRTAQAKGDEIWSYTALVQDPYSPKWEIDFAPVNYRIMPGFLSQSLGLTGILYWRVDLWTQLPWQDVYGFTLEKNYYPGEGMLIYPGNQVGISSVVPSMRLKWIRKGVEDYEYVALLKTMGRGDWAKSRIGRAATDWRNWTDDTAILESVRHELGDEIERLSAARAHK